MVRRFDTVADLLEPLTDGIKNRCFISCSYDATSHFETAANDVLSLYERITGTYVRYFPFFVSIFHFVSCCMKIWYVMSSYIVSCCVVSYHIISCHFIFSFYLSISTCTKLFFFFLLTSFSPFLSHHFLPFLPPSLSFPSLQAKNWTWTSTLTQQMTKIRR